MPQDLEKDVCQVWYNPVTKWFQLYTKDGEPINNLMGVSVTIDDCFDEHNACPARFARAKVEFIVQVRSEEPKPKQSIEDVRTTIETSVGTITGRRRSAGDIPKPETTY